MGFQWLQAALSAFTTVMRRFRRRELGGEPTSRKGRHRSHRNKKISPRSTTPVYGAYDLPHGQADPLHRIDSGCGPGFDVIDSNQQSLNSPFPARTDSAAQQFVTPSDRAPADARGPFISFPLDLGAPMPEAPEIPSRQGHWLLADMAASVAIDTDVSLLVSVGKTPNGRSRGQPLKSFATNHGGANVNIIVQAPSALLPTEPLEQVVFVPETTDSEPVRFGFRTRYAGLFDIQINAFAGGTFLGELSVQLSVGQTGAPTTAPTRVSEILSIKAEPGEVTLQVRFDGRQYVFQLLSEEYLFEPVPAKSLTAQPSLAIERTVATLRSLAGQTSGYSGKNARTWLEQSGISLWNDMVPDLVKEQFWQLHDRIGALSIACGRDTIPWELLYPLAPGRDSGFLVEQFPVMRRAYGQRRSPHVGIVPPIFVVPPGSPANAIQEASVLREKLSGNGDLVSDLGALLDVINRGEFGGLHFACHNTFRTDSGGSSILMGGGQFVPELLSRAVTTQSLNSTNPLIFINACRSAGEIPEYTKLLGWAGQFMSAGAGAFIGTLWAIRSSNAFAFADAFYDSFLGGQSLGSATTTARRAVAADTSDPTWLAYAVYGAPNAIARLQPKPGSHSSKNFDARGRISYSKDSQSVNLSDRAFTDQRRISTESTASTAGPEISDAKYRPPEATIYQDSAAVRSSSSAQSVHLIDTRGERTLQLVRDTGALENILRRQWDTRQPPQPAVVAAIESLAELPEVIKVKLANSLDGIYVGVGGAPDLDDLSRLHGVPFPGGKATWDACAAAYTERKIVIGTRPSPAPDVACHEVGHALDDIDSPPGKWQSDSAEFRLIYDQCTPYLVSLYHREPGGLGRKEFFADAFASIASHQRPALVDMLGGQTRITLRVMLYFYRRYGV